MKYSDVPFYQGEYKISNNSLANLFSVELVNGNYIFRSNKSIAVIGSDKASQELYDMYRFSTGDSWASISYKAYGTTDLWWIICKFNNFNNPNIIPKTGQTILLPKKDVVDYILREIKISGSRG